jgi:DNA-binding NarL/FixJ family response regulator
MSPGTILVVEDDELFARVLGRFFARYAHVRAAASVETARAAVVEEPLPIAIVTDISLPDGSGLDLLEWARKTLPTVPALVLTGHVNPELINRAQRLRAEYAVKPVDSQNLEAFAQHALASAVASRPDRIAVQRWARQHHLTPRETQIAAIMVGGTSREDLPRVLGLSDNTVKTHVRRMLRKCKVRDLGDLTQRLLKEGRGSS